MSQIVRVNTFSLSADGYGAGPDQSLEAPLGVGGEDLHGWFVKTATFQGMYGSEPGETGVDERFAREGMENLGCWILGRNMFGPVRGPWPDDSWTGWWGDEPPYHCPVVVLTNHAREPLEMKGGTVFHFETGGIEKAMERARAFAGDKDIRIGGGVETVQQYLRAGLIDRLHLVVSPVLLGRGEAFWAGIDLNALGYRLASSTPGERCTHLIIERA